MMRMLVGAVLMFLATSAATAGETIEVPRVEKSAVLRLLDSSDVHSLDKAYKRLRPNCALDILYRSLRLRMEPSVKNERALLSTVPRSSDEFGLFRTLDDPAMGEDALPILSEVVDGYFERVARLTVRYHASFEPYLRLHSFTDGYARTDSEEWLDWLFNQDKEAFLSAFHSLDQPTKHDLCGDACGEYESK